MEQSAPAAKKRVLPFVTASNNGTVSCLETLRPDITRLYQEQRLVMNKNGCTFMHAKEALIESLDKKGAQDCIFWIDSLKSQEDLRYLVELSIVKYGSFPATRSFSEDPARIDQAMAEIYSNGIGDSMKAIEKLQQRLYSFPLARLMP